jgi:hypothetical protein
MKRIFIFLSSIVISSSMLFSGFNPLAASEVPLTIEGVINCAHPDNAITTTCRGEAPPPTVTPLPADYVPAAVPSLVTPSAPPSEGSTITYSGDTAIDCSLETSKSSPICAPFTNPDGSINCAQADNAITTTCWELAQSARKAGGSPIPPQVDCSLDIYKNYPVCTGITPQSVVDLEKSKANATPLPETVNCADPMLAQTGACTNRTTTDLPADCALIENSNLPRCQPMTLADGSINCAQPDNAVTNTCWEQARVMKSLGAKTAIDCSLPGYEFYPACTGVKPQAVIDFEKSVSAITGNAEPSKVLAETITAQNVAPEVKISGSVDLKSRSAKATVLKIDLDLAKANIRIVATKKGSPTLTQNVSADAKGNKTVTFKRNLKGYTIKIIYDGETIDTLKI